MLIVRSSNFLEELDIVLDFIACDSLHNALQFNKNLKTKINNLLDFPYKFRQSIYFDDKNIRDLIYKGYTIPYFIDKKNDTLVILGILKYKKL
jgi:plasmid stabilization system protein ParE